MKTRLSRVALGALVIASGCGAPPAEKRIALQIEPQPPLKHNDAPVSPEALGKLESAPSPAPQISTADSASILARKTASYAQNMQKAMSHRTVANVPSTSQDSLVQWLDPNDFKIGEADDSAPKSVVLAPATQPAMIAPAPTVIQASAPEANAGAAVASARTDQSNAPAVLPPEPDKASAVLPGAVESYEARITKRFKDYPRDVSANLEYQTMLFLRDEPVPQLQALTNLPTEDRELISAVMDGLSNFRSTLRSDNNMLFSRKIRPLVDLADRLKQQAELSIPTLVLCTKVEGFGRYDPIDPPRFPAQKEAQAIVYCELENFSSRQNDQRQWQTDVTQEAILYTEEGMQVWADKTQTIQDISRHRRHDFFLRTLVKLPPTLTVGRYMLKVTIVDRQANRVAEASLPIQIVAQ